MQRGNSLRATESIGNYISRSTVQSADDSQKWQEVDHKVFQDEQADTIEHVHPYGFTSVPKKPDQNGAAEGIVAYLGGDRSHGVLLVVGDRRYQPDRIAGRRSRAARRPGPEGAHHAQRHRDRLVDLAHGHGALDHLHGRQFGNSRLTEQPVARVGDSHSHGGTIVSGATKWTCSDAKIARVTDRAVCSIHGLVTIVSGSPNWQCEGQPIARVGSLLSCGAVIVEPCSPNWKVT
jgi:uncharacterized Zn-binding protein involved in type VI secretion